MSVNISVASKVGVKGLTVPHLEHLKKTLTIKNPEYNKMVAMKKSVRNVPKEYVYYTEKDGNIFIPRGMRSRLKDFLGKVNETFTEDTSLIGNTFLKPGMLKRLAPLREHQEVAVVESLKHEEGILCLSTGSGKTITALELASRLELTTTILVPNTILLEQFAKECEYFYGFSPGRIGAGRKEIRDVTVATFQSLIADEELLMELAAKTGMLIVDECHGVPAPGRMKVVQRFRPQRLYGMTGTAERSKDDGRSAAISFLLGSTVYSYTDTLLKPAVRVIRTGINLPVREEYHQNVDSQIENLERNKAIAGHVMGEVVSGRKCLILTKRVEHIHALRELLPPDDPEIFIIEADDKEKGAILSGLKEGLIEYSAVIGTMSLLGTGLDIPSFDTLFIVGDLKSEVLTTQSVGRILRIFEGKQVPLIYDFYDNRHPIFAKQFENRLSVYKAKGWTIDM